MPSPRSSRGASAAHVAAAVALDDTPQQRSQRAAMVDAIRARGVRDRRVLDAMRSVPRHWFVSGAGADEAYEPRALTTSAGLALPEPHLIATRLEALELRGDERVLEVGTGSAYETALLAKLAKQVYSLDACGEVCARARELLDRLGYTNVEVIEEDGLKGWSPAAPYRAILVAAGATHVPAALVEQLDEEGRLVIPIGDDEQQLVNRLRKRGLSVETETLTWCRLPPLSGGPRRRPSWPWAQVARERS